KSFSRNEVACIEVRALTEAVTWGRTAVLKHLLALQPPLPAIEAAFADPITLLRCALGGARRDVIELLLATWGGAISMPADAISLSIAASRNDAPFLDWYLSQIVADKAEIRIDNFLRPPSILMVLEKHGLFIPAMFNRLVSAQVNGPF